MKFSDKLKQAMQQLGINGAVGWNNREKHGDIQVVYTGIESW